MKNTFYLFLIVVGLAFVHGCSKDDFPVPPASTVPLFTNTISNNEFAPATVTFTNESIVPVRAGAVSYQWSFGDGASSTEISPTHLYKKPGVYKVKLVVVTTGSLEINETENSIVIKDPNATGKSVFFTDGTTVFTALINDQEPVRTSIGISTLQDSYGMGIDTVNDKLYIADFDAGKILVSNLDGSNLKDFRVGIGGADAVTIDYVNNKIYWDTSDEIRRADLANTDVNQFEIFASGKTNDPEGMSIDAVNQVIYWNSYDGGVWKKKLDGTGETEIIPGNKGAGMLVIGDRIYFDEFIANGDVNLKSAKLDGTGITTVASGITRRIFGIAYDPSEDKIYWVDRAVSIIRRANLNGSSPEPWHTGTNARGLVIGKKI